MVTLKKSWLNYVPSLQQRSESDIELLVIHCTELPDLATAREYAEVIHYPASATGNAGHFYIDRDGSQWAYVPLNRVAHHVSGHNETSVGIELVNTGRYPRWFDTDHQAMTETYPDLQIASLISLINTLAEALPSLKTIAGHEDLDQRRVPASNNPTHTVRRKLDPGPRFPWPQVLSQTTLKR